MLYCNILAQNCTLIFYVLVFALMLASSEINAQKKNVSFNLYLLKVVGSILEIGFKIHKDSVKDTRDHIKH